MPSPEDTPHPALEGASSSSSSDVPELPPPPIPSSDPALVAIGAGNTQIGPQSQDNIYSVSPKTAMKLLGSGIEVLSLLTGDIPPTPPLPYTSMPHMRGMQLEKESIIRSNSEKDLARMREQAVAADSDHPHPPHPASPERPPGPQASTSHLSGSGASTPPPQPIDGVRLRETAAPPSLSTKPTQEPYVIIGENSQPLNLQHGAITRKFYSRKPPPITIEDYLARLHQFCPMSTAVYLATSLYIYRLAVEERAIPVTRRNAHRLLLAGLRVAMKALEDLSYPHSKMARVGGVSETELSRLEISFCFLTNFELVVRADTLQQHYEVLKQGTSWNITRQGPPKLTLNLRPKDKTSSVGKENESQ